jgi:hypothetical protein
MVSKYKRIRAQFRTHMPQKLTAEIINAAIEGFETQKRRIDSQIDELRQLLNPVGTGAAPASAAPAPKRKISAAGRRRMAAAQQARWAKVRGQADLPSSPAASKPARKKRKLSAAGRKAISEATKKRWALKRAEAQNPRPTAAKAVTAKRTAGKKQKKVPRAAEAVVTATAQ